MSESPASRPDIDLDDRLTENDPRLAPWRAFLTAYALVTERLDSDLQAEQALSLAEYSALLQVAESPGRRLRMSRLADGVFLSRSGITRLVDRLEADGLVARCQCTSDGRGAEAELTAAGLARLRAASRTHLRGIKAYFVDAIDDAELESLGQELRAVGDRIRAGAGLLGAACELPTDQAQGTADIDAARAPEAEAEAEAAPA